MRPNPVKHALLANEPTTGCWLTLTSAAVAESLAHCGFDWLVIDMEHAPNDMGSTTDQLRAIAAARSEGSQSEAVVRVTSADPELVKRVMDAGCSTILLPNVNTAEQAQLVASAMRFPDGGNGGTRGVAGLVRAGRYGLDPDFVAQANDRACTIVQIESDEAVRNVEAIAAVPGVDGLFIGSADLSASMGLLGQPTHPQVRAAVLRIVAAARDAGKSVGAFAVSVEDARWYRDQGVAFIALHSDVAWLTRGATTAREQYGH